MKNQNPLIVITLIALIAVTGFILISLLVLGLGNVILGHFGLQLLNFTTAMAITGLAMIPLSYIRLKK